MFLIHGFNHTDPTTTVAVRAFERELGSEFIWLARDRYHLRLRSSGYRGTLVDEDQIASGRPSLGLLPRAIDWKADDRETLNLLADREGTASSQFEMNLRVEGARLAAWQAIERYDIEGAIFDDVPHGLATYVMSKALRTLGRPVVVVRSGPAPHQRVAVLDQDASLVSQIDWSDQAPPHPRSLELIERLSSDYKAAEPTYMRQQRRQGGLVRRSARKLVQARASGLSFSAIDDARTVRQRASLRKTYESTCEPAPGSVPFVTVFLHLQPERTTVPEGGRFAQQLLVVEHLRRAVPDDWIVAVREHPSTFMTGPKLVRTAAFYEIVRSIRGVQLVSLDEDPFNLITASRAVATVTGTVGLEAASRGVPAIFYGNPSYVGCPGVTDARQFSFGDDALLAAALGSNPSSEGVLGFLARFDSSPGVWTPESDDDRSIDQIFLDGDLYKAVIHRAARKIRGA